MKCCEVYNTLPSDTTDGYRDIRSKKNLTRRIKQMMGALANVFAMPGSVA